MWAHTFDLLYTYNFIKHFKFHFYIYIDNKLLNQNLYAYSDRLAFKIKQNYIAYDKMTGKTWYKIKNSITKVDFKVLGKRKQTRYV